MEIDKNVMKLIDDTRQRYLNIQALKTKLNKAKDSVEKIENQIAEERKKYESDRVRCTSFLIERGGKMERDE